MESHPGGDPLRVVVLSGAESVPWVPIVDGFLEGFRELGCAVQLVRISANHHCFVRELEAIEPDLVVLPVHRHEWKQIGPYLRSLERPVVAATNYDDPYDLETGLAIASSPVVDYVFTPEPLCVDVYRSLGKPSTVLPPFVGRRMHQTALRDLPADPVYDLFWFGGTQWHPRAQILPGVRQWCRRRGLVYGEVAGQTRWVVGRDLAAQLAVARMTLEIPRFDLPIRTNPYQVPCTSTGPRVHIAAATRTFAIVCEGKPDGVYSAFPRCTSETLISELDRWIDAPEEKRAERAHLAGQEYLARHQPRRRVARMLMDLIRATLLDGVTVDLAGYFADDPATA